MFLPFFCSLFSNQPDQASQHGLVFVRGQGLAPTYSLTKCCDVICYELVDLPLPLFLKMFEYYMKNFQNHGNDYDDYDIIIIVIA